MIAIRIYLVVVLMIGAPVSAGNVVVLNYHDVVAEPGNDRFAVSRSLFVAHMDYLQQNGYRPIALTALELALATQASLPEKTVLLTFDDGLKSYHDFVVPLLEIYQFPSVISLVTAWLDRVNVPPEYRGKIMSWEEARQIAASRWVGVVSHTHDLHQGILANSRGNERGAAVTRQYFPATKNFEDEVQFRDRVRRDLALSSSRMQQELKRAPRAVAWPYGEYNEVVLAEARALGMNLHLVLGDPEDSGLDKDIIVRTLVVDRPDVASFAKLLANSTVHVPQHFAELSLDAYVGKTEAEQEVLLSNSLDRLAELQVNAVIITPVSADGRRAFFTTSACATAADVLDRVVHQIRNRLNVRRVVLRLPANLQVKDPQVFFTDMARLTWFNALLFASETRADYLKMVREVVARHRPHIKYGVFGDLSRSAEFDFLLVSSTGFRGAAHFDPTRVWVAISGVRDERALREVVAQLGAQGVLNYGVPMELVLGDGKPREVTDRTTRSGG